MIHRFQFSANCRRYVVAIAIVSAALGSVATAEDWPQWRGANRDGRWTETGIRDDLPDGTLPAVWSIELGAG